MIEIALVTNNVSMREFLKELFIAKNEFVITQETADSTELASLLQHTARLPAVVVTDVTPGSPKGISTPETLLLQHYPAIKVLDINTCYDKPATGTGIFPHRPNYQTLSKKIREIVDRKDSIPGTKHTLQLSGNPFDASSLTGKQKLFLQLCTTELTYKEIAEQMNITPKTTDRYRDELFKKLNIKSRVGLALYAVRNGLATL